MIAGLYLGEIFRLVMVDLHDNHEVHIFGGQDISKLRRPYTLDSSFLSLIEEYVFQSRDFISFYFFLVLLIFLSVKNNMLREFVLMQTQRSLRELVRNFGPVP